MSTKVIRSGRQHDVDMTEGSVFRHLLLFSLPLLAGNLFQQLYNTVDTWVVGNFVSNEAFSAVGAVGPIAFMLIGAFSGLASGAGVVISQYYGAKNFEKVRAAVHTAILMTVVLTICITALGLSAAPHLLRFMKVPDEVFPEAMTYLDIYLSGIVGMLFYNMGAGILRAVGDSRRPFYFLCVAATLNTLLDLLLVIKFRMGVAGVAIATVIAQCTSAILTMWTLFRTDSCVRVSLKYMKPDWPILGKIVKVGIPAALQMGVTNFSNIFVQSYINQFGADCMSGWTAYNKMDAFIFMPMQSIALAVTTFVGQNLGVGNVERAKKGVRTALTMGVTVSLTISAVVISFAPSLVAFFNSKPAVVGYGTMLLRWLTPFYFLCCFNQVYSSALRGAGDSKAPMFIMLGSFVLFRQIYLYVMSHFIANEIIPLAMGYPAGWFVCSVISMIYYKSSHWENKRLVDRTEIQTPLD